jgi:hypothetical protein
LLALDDSINTKVGKKIELMDDVNGTIMAKSV